MKPVSPLASRPSRFRVGNHGPAFTRSGDGDYKLSEQEELYLVSQRAQPIHDRAPVEGASVQRDLVPELLDQYLEAQLNESHRLRSMDREELLIRTNVIDHETGFPTVAAIYAMGIHPQQFLPHLTVKAHARPDAGQSSALRLTYKTEFSGPVPDLLDAVTDWVHKHRMHGIAFHQGHGFNAPELPAVAVREVVANALVHRDLSPASFGSFPMVVKLPAKLIVENPGGLWGLTEQERGKTSPRARNAILYRMCSAITTPSGRRVIEGHATGIPEVRRVLREAFLPEPFFNDEGIKFRALLSSSTMLDTDALSWISSLPGGEHFTVAQKHALIAMKKGNEITNAAYRTEFPMDSVQARDELQQLVHFDLVRKTGAGRSTAYELQTDPVQPSFAFDTLPTPNRSPADIVLTALRSRATPVSRKQLIADTGLTDAQTYRVLRHLEDQGSVATDKDPADGESCAISWHRTQRGNDPGLGPPVEPGRQRWGVLIPNSAVSFEECGIVRGGAPHLADGDIAGQVAGIHGYRDDFRASDLMLPCQQTSMHWPRSSLLYDKWARTPESGHWTLIKMRY